MRAPAETERAVKPRDGSRGKGLGDADAGEPSLLPLRIVTDLPAEEPPDGAEGAVLDPGRAIGEQEKG
jgi:hypothetical protein